MFYKGKEIEDHCYVSKSEMISGLHGDDQNFGLDEIEAWKELIIKKTEELKSSGVDFKNVKINIVGDCYRYIQISIKWDEMETDEEREIRINKHKARIDEQIVDEQRKREGIEEEKNLELERALEVIKRHGYGNSIIEII